MRISAHRVRGADADGRGTSLGDDGASPSSRPKAYTPSPVLSGLEESLRGSSTQRAANPRAGAVLERGLRDRP